MKGQWILVLLCLSLVGELVLGSLFPPQNPESQQQTSTITQGQEEVIWPTKTLAMTPDVRSEVIEAKEVTRGFHAEQDQEKNLSVLQAAEISPKINTTNNEQTSVNENVTKNNAEMEIKNLSVINN